LKVLETGSISNMACRLLCSDDLRGQIKGNVLHPLVFINRGCATKDISSFAQSKLIERWGRRATGLKKENQNGFTFHARRAAKGISLWAAFFMYGGLTGKTRFQM
jgi:hypothetical protein